MTMTNITSIDRPDHIELVVPARHYGHTTWYVRVIERGETDRYVLEDASEIDGTIDHIKRMNARGRDIRILGVGRETNFHPGPINQDVAERLSEIEEYYSECETPIRVVWRLAE